MSDYNNLFPYSEYHEMKYDQDKHEIYCPECGRRKRVENSKLITIEKGNIETAAHGYGVLRMNVTWSQG